MFKTLPRQVSVFLVQLPVEWVPIRHHVGTQGAHRAAASDALVRQVFGRLQSKLFPLYFTLAIGCLTLQLGTLAFGPGGSFDHPQLITLGVHTHRSRSAPHQQCCTSLHRAPAARTGVALLASAANGFFVEPKATESMFKRYELENQEGAKDAERIKALRSEFGKLHGLSSMLNLAALVAAVSHGWWLASRMALRLA